MDGKSVLDDLIEGISVYVFIGLEKTIQSESDGISVSGSTKCVRKRDCPHWVVDFDWLAANPSRMVT